MKNDRIRESLDACLTNERVSAALHSEIVNRATASASGRRLTPQKRLVLVLALALALLVATAAAITIAQLVHRDMEPVREFHVELIGNDSDWLLEDKLYYVSLMEEWGLDLNQEKLAKLRSGEGTDAEQELLAGQIIWDCIAAHRLAVYGEVIPDPADQPEPYPIPNSKWLFEMLWHQNDPDADLEEIHAAYEKWFLELHAALPGDTPVPESMTEEQKYAALLDDVKDYMADVMSMSRMEREAAIITAELNEAGTAWQVVIRVKGSDLREVTREWFDGQVPWGDVKYDKESDTYSYPHTFKAY